MKRLIILGGFCLLLIMGCTSDRDYRYIQIDKKLNGKLEDGEAKTIAAPTDSSAYLEAFKKITIARKVHSANTG